MRSITIFNAKVEGFLTTNALNTAFILVYLICNVLLFTWGARDQLLASKYRFPNRSMLFNWYVSIGRGAGSTLNFNLGVILVFASRKVHTWLRRTPIHHFLPLDKVFPQAHIIVGYMILCGTVVHVVGHLSWIIQFDQISFFSTRNLILVLVLGITATAMFLVLFVLSLPIVRNKNYTIFIRSHYVFGILTITLIVLHGMKNGHFSTYKWLIPGTIIFIVDRAAMWSQTRRRKINLSIDSVTIKSGDILKIRIPKPFEYKAGQYAQMCIPKIGKQWRPFTIASAPHETEIIFFIKKMRGWTKSLFELFSSDKNSATEEPIEALIRGPFGAPTQHVYSYERVVLISGGIGATPHLSIAKDINYRQSTLIKGYSERKSQSETDLTANLHSQRLSDIVARFYNKTSEEDSYKDIRNETNARKLYIRMTLQKRASFSRSSTSTLPQNDEENANSEISCDEQSYQIERYQSIFRTLGRTRSRTLSFLHTARVAFIHLLLLILRLSFVFVTAIFRKAKFGLFVSVLKPNAFWFQYFDTILGVETSTFLVLTIGLELWLLRLDFFDRKRRWTNLVILPINVFYDFLNVKSWGSINSRGALTIAHFAIFLPFLIMTFSYRLYRSICSNGMLESGPRRPRPHLDGSVPDVDFVWTTKTNDDDAWLREDLKPFEKSSKVRLNRFVTQQRKLSDLDENIGEIGTYKGRPELDRFFSAVSDSIRSGTDVGVFFCGPSSMGSCIRKVVREVEIRSHLRHSYLSSLSDTELANTVGLKYTENIQKLREYGCNVRFIYREEKFSSK